MARALPFLLSAFEEDDIIADLHDRVHVMTVDDGADVIIDATNLTEQQMAQIEDIVKRKTGIAADKIVITPVGVVEQ